MGNNGGFDVSGLEELEKNLRALDKSTEEFYEQCAKELTQRLLRKVIKRTPTGDYSKEVEVTAKRDGKKYKKGEVYKKKVNPNGKVGGTLRRGWKANQDKIRVLHFGDRYIIVISNNTEYASYVEYGHRTINHKGWVKGQFILTLSEKELQRQAPRILEKKLNDFLKSKLER